MSPTVHQTEHGLLCEVLRGFLVGEVDSAHRAGECGQVGCGAGAALYSLLAAHPLDRRGRCRSCGGPGWLGRRPRVCLVFRKAHYWLRQPTHIVRAHLVDELGVDVLGPRGAADPEATEVLPRTEPDPTDNPGPGGARHRRYHVARLTYSMSRYGPLPSAIIARIALSSSYFRLRSVLACLVNFTISHGGYCTHSMRALWKSSSANSTEFDRVRRF
jgi:hypothetical protein